MPHSRLRDLRVAFLGWEPVLLAALLLTTHAPAGAQCPASVVQLDFVGGPVATMASLFDSTSATQPARVTFDRTLGRLAISGVSGGRFLLSARVLDRFDVTGVPHGTPVTVNLEFRPFGQATSCTGHGCGAEFTGVVRAGADSLVGDASGEGGGTRVLPPLLSLPVTLIAGSPAEVQFYLVFATGPAGGGTVDAGATWGCVGLPPGARVISCSGGDVTPSRTGSWGALKIRHG